MKTPATNNPAATVQQTRAAGEAAHTPFPVLRIPLNEPHHIQTSTGETIAFVCPEHAPFIVRACNSHAALVAALESALVILNIDCADAHRDDDTPNTRARDKVSAALNSAKGVQS